MKMWNRQLQWFWPVIFAFILIPSIHKYFTHNFTRVHEIIKKEIRTETNQNEIQEIKVNEIHHRINSHDVDNSSDNTIVFNDTNLGYTRKEQSFGNLVHSEQDMLKHEFLPLIDDAIINDKNNASLPFMPDFRNPCWNESLPHPSTLYQNNMYDKYVKKNLYQHFKEMRKEYAAQWNNGKQWRVRCLPYFYIIGFPKCGTTDFFKRVTQHPQVIRGRNKELHWWTKCRFGRKSKGVPMVLNDYIDMFDDVAIKIANASVQKGNQDFHPAVTGEASVTTGWLHHIPDDGPDAEEYPVPDAAHSTAAGAIYRVTPQARIIAIVRNPVTRIYSDYLFFVRNTSAEKFHDLVVDSLGRFKQCLASHDVRHCTLNPAINKQYWARLHIGLYYVLLQDWVQLFSEQVLVVPMEHYSHDQVNHLRLIYKFLQLDPLSQDEETRIAEIKRSNDNSKAKQVKGDMLPETKTMLIEFYAPYNKLLADYFNDPRLLWKS